MEARGWSPLPHVVQQFLTMNKEEEKEKKEAKKREKEERIREK